MKSFYLIACFLLGEWVINPVCAQLIDSKATSETKALYHHLVSLSGKKIMFGHQDDLAYGVHWKYEDGRSDIKEVINDFPAVFGWDIGGIEHWHSNNLDSVPFDRMKKFIIEAYHKGAINTISWHTDNPVTGGNSWDTTRAVKEILPGGKYHSLFVSWLDRVATFLNSLETRDGVKIPILFRPFHELNGGWFWWGRPYCSPEEYKDLWKFTIEYLRDVRHIHQLIYVYNTNSFSNELEFTERYPGKELTDMLSLDIYQRAPLNASKEQLENSSRKFEKQLKENLKVVVQIAHQEHKLSALSETGFEAIPVKDWWTGVLYKTIKNFPISYVLVWRNHGFMEAKNKIHYFAPFKGQKSAGDFKKLYKKKRMLFLKATKKINLYQ
ncbi:MAG: beta-mannosidase [Chitinophagaceae bacterium]|nr:beta-mannosidase [Chitinophagaceae bacterium]MCW5914012.1 beta-mannosidase [Chitinophagaceae bacterium]MCZ2395992.1 glycoside hydrolase family 26 protein [Chitinophagales bacterium]